MEQNKQQEVNIIKPKKALLMGFSFSGLLFLGLLFLIFNAFVVVPKWISLPAFIGFLKKSQRFPSNTTNSPEQSTQRMQTLSTSDSPLHTQILNSSPDKEKINFSAFTDMGNMTTGGESIPPQENSGFEEVYVPDSSPLAMVDDTAIDSASPPMSGMDSLNQRNDLGNVKNPKRDTVMDLAPPHKSDKRTTFCNIFNGKWVFDISYPHYRSGSCSFIDEAFDCESNGRPDLDFMKWRWQPRECDLPRFNATDLLEQLRGKRLVFVGDSINRNQWESMLCLLSEAVPDKSRVYEAHHRKITKGKGFYAFMFKDYHCTIEFYATHFLVQEGKARIGRKRRPILRIDKIDKTSSKWKGADILIFNTGHWWTHSKTAEGENYYQEGDKVQPHLNVLTALRRALTTWASWVETHVESRKTQVFFRSYSPSHFWGGQWNSGGKCEGESQPIFNDKLQGHYPEQMRIVEEVIQQMKTSVTFLNVTRMTDFRKDGHPSIYGRRLVPNSQGNIQDCSHWCLPGVPDVWNEILYALLVFKNKTFSGS